MKNIMKQMVKSVVFLGVMVAVAPALGTPVTHLLGWLLMHPVPRGCLGTAVLALEVICVVNYVGYWCVSRAVREFVK